MNSNDPTKLDEVLAMADAAVRPVVLDLDPDTLDPVEKAEGAALAA